MKDNKSPILDENIETVKVKTTHEKIIPKFCTTINVGLLKSKNVILTMAYNEGPESVALIDRIVIDLEHAKQLKDALDKLINES